jgi:predicted nucleic acid-binding protein
MNSIDVINEVLSENDKIKTIRFFKFSTKTKLQDRLVEVSNTDQELISRALKYKHDHSMRFWNALFTVCISEQKTSQKLISESLYHQHNRDYSYVDVDCLNDFIASSVDKTLALNSKVNLYNGDSRHIPLLDLKLPSKNGNDQLAIQSLQALGLTGYLLDSGKSYHFIGSKLISESELIDLLAKFILLDPISDKT